MKDEIIGMYIHQHWSYNHPYCARTWNLKDWEGYVDGLKKIGYNTILVWPVLETMPNPLTKSDQENLEKIAAVIDMVHKKFKMKIYIALCPNVGANEQAKNYSFQERPFFHTDTRIDPGDAVELGKLIAWREQLFTPLKQIDGVLIIDSDPGGYPGSNNLEFIYLLGAHRKMFDRLRPGIDLIYWAHVGWEAYCRFYKSGKFAFGPQEEIEHAFQLLAKLNPEPWGIATQRGPNVADKVGLSSRVIAFNYGGIEGEPSFPLTNFSYDSAYNYGKQKGKRGILGNAQTHCVQLPNTFAYVRGALGKSLTKSDYIRFANGLIPGQGALIVSAWESLSGKDSTLMRNIAVHLAKLPDSKLKPGFLKGLLFGSSRRFLTDLIMQLELKAAYEDLVRALDKNKIDRKTLQVFVSSASRWQQRHQYKNMWWWPNLKDTLEKLHSKKVNEILTLIDLEASWGNSFADVKKRFQRIESFTPQLIKALKSHVKTLD